VSARRWLGVVAAIWIVVLSAAAFRAQSVTRPGDPLPGLTPNEFSLFRLGQDDFLEVETPEEGLGPAFNATSCGGCHNVPAIGGGSVVAEVRAGRMGANGVEGLEGGDGTLVHLFSSPTHGCQPMVPVGETAVIIRRVPIPVFGAGLVEAIPDETLLALEDPDDRDRDGISGRAARVRDVATGRTRIGRFGWKGQHATLLAFSGDAYRNEMGITNDLFPTEEAYGVGADKMRLCDPIPDPEDRREPATGRRGIDNFEVFMQLLAPLARGPITDEVRDGERVFLSIGCADCHRPALTTGSDAPFSVLRQRTVPLFSDLLLHDIGTGDGVPQSSATVAEVRTPALWGLGHRRPLLHDGSATTLEEAILRHRAEADLARRSYEGLPPRDRALLQRFLNSL
jgi:CxxC motif-containing protein (DUF1111 family)